MYCIYVLILICCTSIPCCGIGILLCSVDIDIFCLL